MAHIFVDGVYANSVAVEVREDSVAFVISDCLLCQVSSCKVQAVEDHLLQVNV